MVEALKHQIALLVREGCEPEEISAPKLEKLCWRNPLSTEARKARRFSRLGRLRCAVCSAPLVAKFGRQRRWHFASDQRAGATGRCDHEPETEAHRTLKVALCQFFEETLAARGWSVYLEKHLENGRRPDVLLVSPSGKRVAVEGQFSRISPESLGRRRDAYAAADVEDLWLVGVADPRRAGPLEVHPGACNSYEQSGGRALPRARSGSDGSRTVALRDGTGRAPACRSCRARLPGFIGRARDAGSSERYSGTLC